jgi:hypothetical protein
VFSVLSAYHYLHDMALTCGKWLSCVQTIVELDLIQISLVSRFSTYFMPWEFHIFSVYVDLRWACETHTYTCVFNDLNKLINYKFQFLPHGKHSHYYKNLPVDCVREFFFPMAQQPLFECLGLLISRFHDDTHLRHTTLGRTPLDEWPARCRDLYLTTHNTQKRQTSMPPVVFFCLSGVFSPLIHFCTV